MMVRFGVGFGVGIGLGIGVFAACFGVSQAWDSSFLLENMPVNRWWSHIKKPVLEAQGEDAKILDIGCGMGFSTSETPGSLGIDVDKQAIEKAKIMFPQKNFRLGVVSSWNDNKDYDVSTCIFYLHTVPPYMREKIIETAIRMADKRVVIVDVSPNFIPNKTVLLVNPYLKEYLQNCRDELSMFEETVLVEDFVHQWVLELDKDDHSKWYKGDHSK